MRLLRSWPSRIPPGRAFVMDAMEKLVLDGYDYAPLAAIDEPVVLLEWDVAVDREGLHHFIDRARQEPERVIVAPYRLYVTTAKSNPLPRPVWCHRRGGGEHVQTGEPSCNLFGLGMIYLPKGIARHYLQDRGNASWGFTDASFSGWHHRTVAAETPIIWEVRPVHLHYKHDDLGPAAAVDAVLADRVEMLARWPSAQADEEAAAHADDPIVASLLRERAGLVRQGKGARIAAVNEQLAWRGYTERDRSPNPKES